MEDSFDNSSSNAIIVPRGKSPKIKIFCIHSKEDFYPVRGVFTVLKEAEFTPVIYSVEQLEELKTVPEKQTFLKEADFILVFLSKISIENNKNYPSNIRSLILDLNMMTVSVPELIPVRIDNYPLPPELASFHSIDPPVESFINELFRVLQNGIIKKNLSHKIIETEDFTTGKVFSKEVYNDLLTPLYPADSFINVLNQTIKQQQVLEVLQCPLCEANNSRNYRFCTQCGQDLNWICTCKAVNKVNDKYCHECGKQVKNIYQSKIYDFYSSALEKIRQHELPDAESTLNEIKSISLVYYKNHEVDEIISDLSFRIYKAKFDRAVENRNFSEARAFIRKMQRIPDYDEKTRALDQILANKYEEIRQFENLSQKGFRYYDQKNYLLAEHYLRSAAEINSKHERLNQLLKNSAEKKDRIHHFIKEGTLLLKQEKVEQADQIYGELLQLLPNTRYVPESFKKFSSELTRKLKKLHELQQVKKKRKQILDVVADYITKADFKSAQSEITKLSPYQNYSGELSEQKAKILYQKKNYDLAYSHALLLYEQGLLGYARKEIKTALQISSQSQDAIYINNSLKTVIKEVYSKIEKAEKLFKAGDFENSLETVKSVLEIWTDNEEAKSLEKEIPKNKAIFDKYLQDSKEAIEHQRYLKAEKILYQAYKLCPRSKEVASQWRITKNIIVQVYKDIKTAKNAISIADFPKAKEHISSAEKIYPSFVQYKLSIDEVCYIESEYKKAVDLFYADFRRSRFHLAKSHLSKARELAPNSKEVSDLFLKLNMDESSHQIRQLEQKEKRKFIVNKTFKFFLILASVTVVLPLLYVTASKYGPGFLKILTDTSYQIKLEQIPLIFLLHFVICYLLSVTRYFKNSTALGPIELTGKLVFQTILVFIIFNGIAYFIFDLNLILNSIIGLDVILLLWLVRNVVILLLRNFGNLRSYKSQNF